MSYSVKLEKLARQKQQSREIVSEVLKFGVSEQQKLDIIHGICLSLKSNEALKDINNVLKSTEKLLTKKKKQIII